jgi:acetoacetate decarboxylase
VTDRDRTRRPRAPQDAHSIPWDLPLHGPPPARFRDGEVLSVLYRTDRASIAALVPAPLVPLEDTVLVQVARWGDVPGLGRDTHEVNVMVPVRFDGPDGSVSGSYSPYFFVDSDRAMAGGREFHGQPKRLADVGLEVRGDLVVGTMRRNGIDVLTVTLPYKPAPASIDDLRHEVDFVTNINYKVVPQIDGSPGLRQLTARDLADLDVRECWAGPATIRIEPNAQAPLHRLPVIEMLEGYYWLGDFSLVGGVILHDYSAAAGPAEGPDG